MILLFLALILLNIVGLDLSPAASAVSGIRLVLGTFLLTTLLIVICWKTGERPTWQWGGTRVHPVIVFRGTFQMLGSVAIAEIVGLVGSLFTYPSIATWYVTLHKPTWTPPSELFGPVWVLLYALMGIAAYIVWMLKDKKNGGGEALKIYGVQLVVNGLWSFTFFGLKNPLAALLVLIALWCLILATTIRFWKVRQAAGVIFLPYLAWTTFALALNAAILQLNGW